MPTKTDIVNLALTKLGLPHIEDIDADTPETNQIRTIYPLVVNKVLSQYNWAFATKRAKLAQLAETPEFGWSYAYQLPADFMRLTSTEPDTASWVVESGKLLTNESEIYIRYVSNDVTESQFSPLFATTLATELANNMAEFLTANPDLNKILGQQYQLEINRAATVDSANDSQVSIISDTWTSVRL